MLDSDCNEPQGNTAGSAQALWLQGALAASNATFKVGASALGRVHALTLLVALMWLRCFSG